MVNYFHTFGGLKPVIASFALGQSHACSCTASIAPLGNPCKPCNGCPMYRKCSSFFPNLQDEPLSMRHIAIVLHLLTNAIYPRLGLGRDDPGRAGACL